MVYYDIVAGLLQVYFAFNEEKPKIIERKSEFKR
jgi:hypothetical protein